MRIKSILSKLTIAIILLAVSFSCTDDEIGSQPTDYGYVQFKLIKMEESTIPHHPIPVPLMPIYWTH